MLKTCYECGTKLKTKKGIEVSGVYIENVEIQVCPKCGLEFHSIKAMEIINRELDKHKK